MKIFFHEVQKSDESVISTGLFLTIGRVSEKSKTGSFEFLLLFSIPSILRIFFNNESQQNKTAGYMDSLNKMFLKPQHLRKRFINREIRSYHLLLLSSSDFLLRCFGFSISFYSFNQKVQ